jgi:arginine decarboxylase-like protein
VSYVQEGFRTLLNRQQTNGRLTEDEVARITANYEASFNCYTYLDSNDLR